MLRSHITSARGVMRRGRRPAGGSAHSPWKQTGIHLDLVNYQREVRVDMPLLRQMGVLALPHCSDKVGGSGSVLSDLPVVEVAIVSDAVISAVHRQFLGEDSATDVVTFPYGEVIVSAETASVNSSFYRHSPTVEIAFCLIHGLLHLNGYSDHTTLQAAKMRRRQTKILKKVHQELWLGDHTRHYWRILLHLT
ncbi:Endoribonuclease YbeY [Candidatus Xiphinematobacter sp. Idaho Grape]|uniref:rRNA maturation RNase YbeY n=1 Tax=Candidatus Xiphinematobacter sp. Idaho Grape TaxID=1704307 RepID=UPI0007060F2C|nr:rRNA maturation RNase YbeY [Candidatus Xiphinematobacter sp. Idaho Grape]ALJ56296.1 Endoribonuclease YbeY [Candidatus Xiphinematobacter sp. Idaho Grape]